MPAHAAKTASLLSGRAVVVIRPRARRQDRPPTSRDCVGRMTGHATRRRLRRPQAETAQMMLYNRLFERSFCGFELFALPRTAWHAGSAEFCTARKTSGVLKSTTTRYSAPELAACGGGPPPILRSVCEPPSTAGRYRRSRRWRDPGSYRCSRSKSHPRAIEVSPGRSCLISGVVNTRQSSGSGDNRLSRGSIRRLDQCLGLISCNSGWSQSFSQSCTHRVDSGMAQARAEIAMAGGRVGATRPPWVP